MEKVETSCSGSMQDLQLSLACLLKCTINTLAFVEAKILFYSALSLKIFVIFFQRL